MKSIALVLVITLIFAASVSFAEDKISIDPVVGTWVNPDYDKISKLGKIIIKPDFTREAFWDPTRKELPETYTFIVDESWSDAEGNIYYKLTFKTSWGLITYELWKLDSSQKALESMAGAYRVEHPKAIKPGHASYNIHYRQE
jgi:hypothetical protein